MKEEAVFKRKIFAEKFSSRVAQKYLVYSKDLKKDGDTLCVPIYMVPLLP